MGRLRAFRQRPDTRTLTYHLLVAETLLHPRGVPVTLPTQASQVWTELAWREGSLAGKGECTAGSWLGISVCAMNTLQRTGSIYWGQGGIYALGEVARVSGATFV